MKLVSPLQRGSTCTCRWPGTPAPAARPRLTPTFTPSGAYAARIARSARTWARAIATSLVVVEVLEGWPRAAIGATIR